MKFHLILVAAILSLSVLSCSTKERKNDKHAMDDELEMIKKAKEVSKEIEETYEKRLKDLD